MPRVNLDDQQSYNCDDKQGSCEHIDNLADSGAPKQGQSYNKWAEDGAEPSDTGDQT